MLYEYNHFGACHIQTTIPNKCYTSPFPSLAIRETQTRVVYMLQTQNKARFPINAKTPSTLKSHAFNATKPFSSPNSYLYNHILKPHSRTTHPPSSSASISAPTPASSATHPSPIPLPSSPQSAHTVSRHCPTLVSILPS